MTKVYECGISYDKTFESGIVKKVTEQYLVEAINFSEAENNIIEATKPFTSGDFEVVTIKKASYRDYIQGSSNGIEKLYKAKVKLITLDEVSRKVKYTTTCFLVNAPSVDKAHDIIFKFMSDSMYDYEISNIDETKLLDVFLYNEQ